MDRCREFYGSGNPSLPRWHGDSSRVVSACTAPAALLAPRRAREMKFILPIAPKSRRRPRRISFDIEASCLKNLAASSRAYMPHPDWHACCCTPRLYFFRIR
jgi:hypothetical protein